MSKGDPTFNLKDEIDAQSTASQNPQIMTEEEYRESIIQRTMQALSVSEEFTDLIIKRMQQNDNLRKQQFSSSLVSSNDTTLCKGTGKRRKRKAQTFISEEKSAKMWKGSDDSSEPVDNTYINAQNLRVSNRQPKLLEGAVMRDYQLDGLDWLVALDLNGANGILADEMGLGKTLQVISLLCFLVEMGVGTEAPFLIIGPLSTLHNWVAEFKKFAPKIPVILYHGPKEKRDSLKRDILIMKSVKKVKTYPVIVTSYEIPLRDASLRKINWRYLIIDEGHRLKNHKCLLVQQLRRYHSTNRLLLTGTPLQNNMTELWSLLNFILPNIVNDMDVFECWFDPSFLEASDANERIVQAEEKNKVLTTLHKILKPFLLRRIKADVGLNLPPKKEITVYAQMTNWQQRLYSAIVDKTLHSLQGRQSNLQDPVLIERAFRHKSKKSIADTHGSEVETNSMVQDSSVENDSAFDVMEEASLQSKINSVSTSTKMSVPQKTINFVQSSPAGSPRLMRNRDKTEPTVRSSPRLAKTQSMELLSSPPEKADVNEGPHTSRRPRRRNVVQSGDYKLLFQGVPLNAIREGPVFSEEDSSYVDTSVDKLLEGLANPDEEFVTEIKTAHPVSALRQICNHPYLASFPVIPGTRIIKTDENVVQRSGKMQILDALLTRLKKNGHKVLIFSNFTKMLDIIEDYLELRKYQYTRLDGSRDLSNRQMNIEKFSTDDNVFVFLISTRAGGLGINLVAADTVIIYDSDWNPQADLQAQDRCHRIGQTRPVVVYRFVVRGTMDEHILNRAETKKQLDKLIIQHGKFTDVKKNEMVSLQELRELLENKDKNEVVMDNGLAYTAKELDVLCDRTAVFTSTQNGERLLQDQATEDTAPFIDDLSDLLDAQSECSDSQDAFSLSSHVSSETNGFASSMSHNNGTNDSGRYIYRNPSTEREQ